MPVAPETSKHSAVIEQNRQDYGAIYADLSFPDSQLAQDASLTREALLGRLAEAAGTACGGTKIYTGSLSPGCRLCTEGTWSCLFINGRCNRSCFYCPASQDEVGLPTTNNVRFRSPADYVAYLEKFAFKGMSLSGGEPLLTPGRSLAFLTAAKRRFGDELHSWLYTNGSLVDHEILLRLKDAGLDEIRFDIGADDYSLDKAAMAVAMIPTVTVEIPAVPEKLPLLKKRLKEMADCGIKHLNLHQLRLTEYNHRHLAKRAYTYLHGPRITVLESELAALELLDYGLENNIPLALNYCSSIYKHYYQRAAARGRGAGLFQQPWEDRTAAGYLRTLSLHGSVDLLAKAATRLSALPKCDSLWQLSADNQSLMFSKVCAGAINSEGLQLHIGYAETPVREQLSYRNPFKEIQLPGGGHLYSERYKIRSFIIGDKEAAAYLSLLSSTDSGAQTDANALNREITSFEKLPEGLQEYY